MKRLALLAAGWLAIVTPGCGSAVSTPPPSRSASPTVAATPTLHPSAADTFYLTDVHNNRTLDRVRWDGSSASPVTLPANVECCDNNVFPSPDGSRLLVLTSPLGTASNYEVISPSGTVLERITDATGALHWADDSQRLCELRAPASPTPSAIQSSPYSELLLIGPDGHPRLVARSSGWSYQRGPQLVACSVINDRAIVFDTVMGGVSAVHIYQLSTGKELDPWPGGTSLPHVVIASPDAGYLAGGGFGGGTIWSTGTGQVVGTLPGEPWGFSLDGARVVVEGTSPVYKVLDWRTGTVVFQAPGETFPPRILPRPGSPDLLVGVVDARGPRYYGPTTDSAWIVRDSGVTPLLDQAPAAQVFLTSS